jgi:hypothetical protein
MWLMMMAFAAFGGVVLFARSRPLVREIGGSNPLSVSRSLDALFFTTSAFALLVASGSLYYPPLAYYVFVSIATAAIGVRIFVERRPIQHKVWILGQISLLAILLRTTGYLENPFPPGVDTYVHLQIIKDILSTGHVTSSAGPYEHYPLYHISVAVAKLMGGDLYGAAVLSTIALQSVSVLAIYVIGNRISGPRAGLFAAYIVAFSSMSLGSAVGLQPMAQGVTYFLFAIAGYLSYRTPKDVALFWLPALALFFVHPFASFVLVISLAAAWGTKNALPLLRLRKDRPLYSAFGSYVGAFVAYLIFVDTFLFNTVLRWAFLSESSTPVFGASLHPAKITAIFALEIVVQYLAEATIVALATYVILVWVRNRDLGQTITVAVIVLTAAGPLTNVIGGSYWVGGMVVGRIPPFLWGLLALPAGAALAKLRFGSYSRAKKAVAVMAMFALALTSTASYHSGALGLPTMTQVPLPVTFITESSVSAYSYIMKIPLRENVSTDQWTAYYLLSSRGLYGPASRNVIPFKPDSTEPGYRIFNWPYLGVGTETATGEAITLSKSDLSISGFQNLIMDSGAVTIFFNS